MCCIHICCYFDFIALINLVLMHHDNMRFGLLYYYCLLLRKASPSYMTGSRYPHILNRYQCMASFLSPMMFNCSRWIHPNHETRTPLWYPADVMSQESVPPPPHFPLCPSLNLRMTQQIFQPHQRVCHNAAKLWTVLASKFVEDEGYRWPAVLGSFRSLFPLLCVSVVCV